MIIWIIAIFALIMYIVLPFLMFDCIINIFRGYLIRI
jgi:hypothetical protein